MIEKQWNSFILVCDICGEQAEKEFDNFHDAVDYKKSEGWKSQKRNSQWEDVCPECQ